MKYAVEITIDGKLVEHPNVVEASSENDAIERISKWLAAAQSPDVHLRTTLSARPATEWEIENLFMRLVPKPEEAIQPMQPIVKVDGQLRFQPNKIVEFLLDSPINKVDLNLLAAMDFSDEDRAQFAQLIGYSVDGLFELRYVHENNKISKRIEAAIAQ
jgi:hypothetical protein